MENSVLISGTGTAVPNPLSKRSIPELLAPLDELARKSANFSRQQVVHFQSQGERHELPRYLFVGPQGGDAPIRIGIFAGIHGDEPEGSHAMVLFLQMLDQKPELAKGY